MRDVLESRGLSPMQFQILNPNNKDVRLYTGPLDFCAADGECYLPSWVMKQLGIKAGEPCAVATACFPKGTFAKFQPHKSEFLDIPDHGLMLTTTLENMAALTQGSTVRVTDGRRTYNLDVLEVKGKAMPPGVRDDSDGRAVDLVLAELVTDFEAAKDTLRKKKGGKAPAKAAAAAAADADADGRRRGRRRGGRRGRRRAGRQIQIGEAQDRLRGESANAQRRRRRRRRRRRQQPPERGAGGGARSGRERR